MNREEFHPKTVEYVLREDPKYRKSMGVFTLRVLREASPTSSKAY